MNDEKPPICKCHKTEMRWAKDHTMKFGGRWRCRVSTHWVNRPETYRLVNMVGCRRYRRRIALQNDSQKLLTMKSKREVAT